MHNMEKCPRCKHDQVVHAVEFDCDGGAGAHSNRARKCNNCGWANPGYYCLKCGVGMVDKTHLDLNSVLCNSNNNDLLWPHGEI